MTKFDGIPEATYGILYQDHFDSKFEEVAEQVRRLGYGVLDSGYSSDELQGISDAFDRAHTDYVQNWGVSRLKNLDELNTIRALLTHGGAIFLNMVMNPNLMAVLHKLISGTFILNQQNGVINPPGEIYNQGAWHRDLPYQHYVSSSPLAVNALFCIDDFNFENGSTFVLPGSHKSSAFPSEGYVRENALQVKASAGQYIILDCMLFHSGGFNKTTRERRAINHVYTIPYFKQQINLPKSLESMQVSELSLEARAILGFKCQEPLSIESYLNARLVKMGALKE
jgi:ectoine hydroxylase-related dioxygenase (phytanoyl-CoA dioxygenase family)